jgi:hypothetical protein
MEEHLHVSSSKMLESIEEMVRINLGFGMDLEAPRTPP